MARILEVKSRGHQMMTALAKGQLVDDPDGEYSSLLWIVALFALVGNCVDRTQENVDQVINAIDDAIGETIDRIKEEVAS